MNNRIVCDLRKVQWASYGYINQHDQRIPVLPLGPTVRGLLFEVNAKHMTENMTMLEYARMFHLLDVWEPYVRFTFASNHRLDYRGDKAKSLWAEWGKRIFKKDKYK